MSFMYFFCIQLLISVLSSVQVDGGCLLGANCRTGICRKNLCKMQCPCSAVTGLKLRPVNPSFHCPTQKYFSEVCFVAELAASFFGRRAVQMKSEFLFFFFRIGKCVFTLLVEDWKKAQSTFDENFLRWTESIPTKFQSKCGIFIKLLVIWKMRSKGILRIEICIRLNNDFL